MLDAATALGYQPNSIAKALVTKSTKIVGLIVGDIGDAFFADIVRGVEETARTHGYLTIVCNADRRPEVELTYFNSSAARILIRLFDLLDEAAGRGNRINIAWIYDSEDDNLEEMGEEMGEDLENAKFEMRPVET